MGIKSLIIEDEAPAQRLLKRYIKQIPNLELVGTFTVPTESLPTLKEQDIDVIFLDINLPNISGLNFLKSLSNPPKIIITTAYPEYAIEGFELNVLDYLLKPISFERFLKAVSRLDADQEKQSQVQPSNGNGDNGNQQEFTFIKSDKTIYRISWDEIVFIESDRDYLRIHTTNDKYFIRETLKHWMDLLPEQRFFRVHKSFIVNIGKINEIFGNRIKIGDEIIPIGRHYKDDFFEKIEEM